MTSQLDELERILGGKIELRDQRDIPGVTPIDGTEFLYFEDDGKNKPKKQFNLLLDSAGTIAATSGGVVSDGCCIGLPAGPVFHALSYHGDIAGWRAAVEAGANARGLLLARIEGEQFVISDGRSFPLSECKIEFA
ncbi:hypothetical protein [Ectopseudomonas composti]|jgi:hypothetical protein|uniref:hypothetical protein n=1 Tax=Ectopseudomonas composti TaxID=658457 RepID=UPI0007740554|nr:hypothetical protein [Pseudomonas composti]